MNLSNDCTTQSIHFSTYFVKYNISFIQPIREEGTRISLLQIFTVNGRNLSLSLKMTE